MAVISKRNLRRKGGPSSATSGTSNIILLAGALVLLVVVVLLLSSSSISNAPPGLVEISEHDAAFREKKINARDNLPPTVVEEDGKEDPTPIEEDKPVVVEQPKVVEQVKYEDKQANTQKLEAEKAGNLRGKELFKDENVVENPVVKNVATPEKPVVVPQTHNDENSAPHEIPHVQIVGGGLPNEHSTLYFHHYKKGKAGAVIEDMLMAHAYAFHSKGGYGGACGNIKPDQLADLESLLSAIGLKEALPFACPADFAADTVTRRSMVPRDTYRKDDVRIWTPDYVDFLKTQVKYPPPHMDVNDHRYTIAVHIRRGDVTPCRKENQGYERYLSNLHFQMIIDKYYQPGARVIIFSQEKSFEPWDSFRDRGYELWLDTDVADAWEHMLTSDLVVLSRSSFSFIPGMASKGKVIYTPYWHKPLRRWIHVDQEIMEKSDAETDRLQQTCPKKNKFGGNVLSHEAGHHKEAHKVTGHHHYEGEGNKGR